jgi:D-alanine-D-alanine ligase
MARELEVSVLGNWEPRASIVGEVIPTHEFYSYEAKYIDENGAHLKIPAEDLTEAQKIQIQELAVQAFKTLECRGLARVDFFLDRQTKAIYLNEINTIPGFTSISMYPKLWEATGLSYSDLLEELIRLALERHQEKNSLKTSYDSK